MRKYQHNSRTAHLAERYRRLAGRLNKAMTTGRFARLAAHRQQQLLRLLGRYEHRLRRTGYACLLSAPLLLTPGSGVAQVAVGGEFQVNTNTLNFQIRPSVATDSDGDFVVVWQSFSQDGSNYGIYGQRYNKTGTPAGTEFRINTTTADAQKDPKVAMDSDGDFVVTWTSYGQDGGGYGVYAQRYDNGGLAVGAEFQVNTYTDYDQFDPSVAMDNDGDFVIAWEGLGQDGSGSGIYAQRYASTGATLGDEFRVNATTTSSQAFPSVAMDSNGDFVIAWSSRNQDGDGAGVYAQRYDNTGITLGGEFRVNTTTTNYQEFPSVAMDSDGDFVISWSSYSQDGSNYGVYAQRYDNTGVGVGSEFQVNTYTDNFQNSSSVAMDNDGDYIVTWNSRYQDGSFYGIYAQRYDNTGATVGGEFQVNTYTTGSQLAPSATMDTDGNFVVAWQSNGSQDGSSYGIYAQRYSNAILPVTLTHFTARADDQQSQLHWQTTTELNNRGFEVQWATAEAPNDWQTLDFVAGAGTTDAPQDYRFTHQRPATGLNYYRLRQLDFDGNFEYSEIQTLAFTNAETPVLIYPNPVHAGYLMVNSGITNADMIVRIFDATGRLHAQRTDRCGELRLNTSELAAGIYFVEVLANGTLTRERVVIE